MDHKSNIQRYKSTEHKLKQTTLSTSMKILYKEYNIEKQEYILGCWESLCLVETTRLVVWRLERTPLVSSNGRAKKGEMVCNSLEWERWISHRAVYIGVEPLFFPSLFFNLWSGGISKISMTVGHSYWLGCMPSWSHSSPFFSLFENVLFPFFWIFLIDKLERQNLHLIEMGPT